MPAYKDEREVQWKKADGTIAAKKRVTWYASFSYVDLMGNRQRKVKRGFATKKEALDWEQAFKAAKKGSCSMKLDALHAAYLEDKGTSIRPQTLQKKQKIYQSRIQPAFGSLAVNAITPVMLLRWQNELQAQYTTGYVKAVKAELSAVFNHAVRYYGLAENPLHRVEPLQAVSDASTEMGIWEPKQFEQFLETIPPEDQQHRLFFEILYWCGLRKGEAAALTPQDVDEKGVIHVTKTLVRRKGESVLGAPKTKAGVREVWMPAEIHQHWKTFLASRYGIRPDDLLFPSCRDSIVNAFMIRHAQKAGLPPIRVHDLRHSHASLLIHRGVPLTAIAKRLGHESPDITLKIYAHMMPQSQDDVVRLLDDEMSHL